MFVGTELMLNIPKIVQLLVYVVLAIVIYRRSDYILNRILALAFAGWAVYICMDAIFFSIGAIVNPVGLTTAATGAGPLFVINIMRDVAVVAASCYGFLMLGASLVVRYGEKKLQESKPQILVIVIVAVLFIVPNVALDWIIYNQAPLVGVNTDIGIGAIFIVLIIIVYLIGLVFFIQTYRESPPERKRKILYLIIGLIMVPLGLIYWVVMSFLPFTTLDPVYLAYQTFGHLVLWTPAPIFMYLGIRGD